MSASATRKISPSRPRGPASRRVLPGSFRHESPRVSSGPFGTDPCAAARFGGAPPRPPAAYTLRASRERRASLLLRRRGSLRRTPCARVRAGIRAGASFSSGGRAGLSARIARPSAVTSRRRAALPGPSARAWSERARPSRRAPAGREGGAGSGDRPAPQQETGAPFAPGSQRVRRRTVAAASPSRPRAQTLSCGCERATRAPTRATRRACRACGRRRRGSRRPRGRARPGSRSRPSPPCAARARPGRSRRRARPPRARSP